MERFSERKCFRERERVLIEMIRHMEGMYRVVRETTTQTL